MPAVPAHAAGGTTPKSGTVNWQDRDTATYVVSTLNLVRTPQGRAVTETMHAATYVMLADTARSGLYFVDLHDRSDSIIGSFVYWMGWMQAVSLTRLPAGLHVRTASAALVQAYHQDPKRVIGVFTSTFPN